MCLEYVKQIIKNKDLNGMYCQAIRKMNNLLENQEIYSKDQLVKRLNPDKSTREIQGVIQAIDGFPLQILESYPLSSPSHLAFIIDFIYVIFVQLNCFKLFTPSIRVLVTGCELPIFKRIKSIKKKPKINIHKEEFLVLRQISHVKCEHFCRIAICYGEKSIKQQRALLQNQIRYQWGLFEHKLSEQLKPSQLMIISSDVIHKFAISMIDFYYQFSSTFLLKKTNLISCNLSLSPFMIPTSFEDPDFEITSALSKITSLYSDQSLFQLGKEYGKTQEALYNKKNSKRALRKGTKPLIVSMQLIRQIRSIHEFMIFGGVQVIIDDEIHLQSNLQAMNIGSLFQNPLRIAIQKDIQRIDCQMGRNPGLTDFKFLAELCRRKQQLDYLQLSQLLEAYQTIVLRLSQLKQKYLKLSKQQLLENDREYQLFLEHVYKIINAKDPNKIFKYCILRMNYILEDLEFQTLGMSFGYLHMLGLSSNLFGQLFLRGKAIDLANLNTREELFATSMETLAQRLTDITQGRTLHRRIKTVDGFPLLITETIQRIQSPFKEYSLCGYEHLAFVNDYEIDQDSLQKLQEYRGRAFVQSKNSITQEIMEEELSDQFEDIEYTLKAEEFMQKYYPQKMANMHQNQ